MALLFTVIALHTCHILSSVALRLMLLGSTTIGARVLRRTGTLLRCLTMVTFPAPGPRSFGSECHTRRRIYLYTLLLHFQVFGDCLKGLDVLTVCHDCFKFFQCSLSLGRALITFRTCSSSETSCPTALRS